MAGFLGRAKGKGTAIVKPPTTLAFKALSTVFRELQAPELEAAQAEVARLKEELALANARLDEADDETRCNDKVMKHACEEGNKLRRKIWHLERDNRALTQQADGLLRSTRALSGDNERLRETLYNRRRKGSADAAA